MKFNKNQTLGFTSKLSNFEIINSEFTRCKCYMLAVGDNVNGSDITLDSVKKAMSRGEFYNKPIVAHLYKDEDTYNPLILIYDIHIFLDIGTYLKFDFLKIRIYVEGV